MSKQNTSNVQWDKLSVMQRKMSVKLIVTSKGEGILTLVGTNVSLCVCHSK